MAATLILSHCVFPVPDIQRTAEYYVIKLGFDAVSYLDAKEPHICLYRDSTEIILTKANTEKIFPNRELYGYAEDVYFITQHQEELQAEFLAAGVKVVRPLARTDYNNREFVIEDIDGRWIAFGIKGD